MDNLLKRYTPDDRKTITSFFNRLAMVSNKTGKMQESKKVKIIESWESYPPDVVMEALNIYLSLNIEQSSYGKGKNEKYVLGIIKNKAKEYENTLNKKGVEMYGRSNANRGHIGNITGKNAENAGTQLLKKRETRDDELECNF